MIALTAFPCLPPFSDPNAPHPLMRGCPPLSSSGSSQVSPNPPSESWVPTLARPWNQETSANPIATDIHMCALHTAHFTLCAHWSVLTHSYSAFTHCSSKLAFLLVQLKRKHMWAIFPERVHYWRNILSCTPKTCVVYILPQVSLKSPKWRTRFDMLLKGNQLWSSWCNISWSWTFLQAVPHQTRVLLGPTLFQFFLRLPWY